MKRNLALLLLTSLLVCCTFGLIACNKTTHTHSIEKVEAKAATCETAGNIEHYRCDGCDKLFSDESYTETTLEETIIAALGHDEESHDAKAATCTEDGWDAYVTCKRDGCDYTTYQKKDAIGHKNKVHHVKVNATCTEAGTIEYWSCPDCNKNYSDEACTKVVTELTIAALDHDMQPVAKKDATCTETGYDAYEQCSRCDHNTKGNDIPALGHANKVHHEKVNATCTEAGTIEYWSCPDCNKNYSDEACTKVVTELTIAALDHDYSDTVIDPTYDEQGYTLHTCSRCGDEYKDTYTDVLVHTCQSKCSLCGGCANADCKDAKCVTKCACKKVVHEAETVTSNRNEITPNGNQMGERSNEYATGGVCIGGVGEVSLEKPGYYYFKWKVSTETACKVQISIRLGCGIPIDVSKGFIVKLNDATVALTGTVEAYGFNEFRTETLGVINFASGNNELYIYIGEGVLANIDYFEFTSKETLTFDAKEYKYLTVEAEDTDMEKAVNGSEEYPYFRTGNDSSSGRYLGGINDAGVFTPGQLKMSFTVTASEDTTANLYFGAGVYETVSAGAFSIYVGETKYTSVLSWQGEGWSVWKDYLFANLALKTGDNVITVQVDGGATLNLDYFKLESEIELTVPTTDGDDTPVYANVYKHEAEAVTSNRSESADLGERENATSSGGCHLGGVGEVSNANPGYYYFKWSITVDKACEVLVSMGMGVPMNLNLATAFPAKLGDETVLFDKEIVGYGWTDFRSYDLGTINLSAGENVFYIYIGANALCNIDYFVFSSNETLTFNATSVDA